MSETTPDIVVFPALFRTETKVILKKIIMAKEVVTAFEECSKKLQSIIERFDSADINKIPFEGSWTAGQLAEHVIKSQNIFPGLMTGKTVETMRPVEEKREMIEKIFLDFSNKMKSPDFIIPSAEPHDKEILVKEIREKREENIAALTRNDLTRTLPAFELPAIGTLTGREWGWFITYHTQRHIHQLENIFKKLYN